MIQPTFQAANESSIDPIIFFIYIILRHNNIFFWLSFGILLAAGSDCLSVVSSSDLSENEIRDGLLWPRARDLQPQHKRSREDKKRSDDAVTKTAIPSSRNNDFRRNQFVKS